LALLRQQLQVAQKQAERALLLASLLRTHCPCPFQQGHRIAAALQFFQRLPLGIPELAERQQPFLWCTGRMVAPLELGALADRLLELEPGLVKVGE
jgi:hypothetical protein